VHAQRQTIPKGFKSGEPVATLLKGKTITVGTEEKAMAPGSKMMVGQATVTDAAGNVAHVVAPNYFTGAEGHTIQHNALTAANEQRSGLRAPAQQACTTCLPERGDAPG
jgi:hypothetical protein